MKTSTVKRTSENYYYQVVKRAKLPTEQDVEGTPVRVTGYKQVTLTTDKLAEDISHACSLTESDIVGVLSALGSIMGKALASGKRVNLEGIGTFGTTLTLKAPGKGGETPEQKTTDDHLRGSQISIGKVTFAPCEKLWNQLRMATFVSSGVKPDAPIDPEELDELLTAYFATHEMLYRSRFDVMLDVSRRKADEMLKSLVSDGKLVAHGHRSTRFYTAAPGFFGK